MTLPLSNRTMRRVGVWLSWLGTDDCLSYSTEQTGREPFLLYLLFLKWALCSGYWLSRHSVGGRTNDSAVTVWLCDYEFPHTISHTLPSPLSLSFCLSKSHLRCHASMSDEHGPVSQSVSHKPTRQSCEWHQQMPPSSRFSLTGLSNDIHIMFPLHSTLGPVLTEKRIQWYYFVSFLYNKIYSMQQLNDSIWLQ